MGRRSLLVRPETSNPVLSSGSSYKDSIPEAQGTRPSRVWCHSPGPWWVQRHGEPLETAVGVDRQNPHFTSGVRDLGWSSKLTDPDWKVNHDSSGAGSGG